MWALKAKKRLIVKSLLVAVLVILAAIALDFGFVKKSSDDSKSKLASNTKPPAPPSLVEKTDAVPTKTALSNSDYASYQNLQRTLALQYLYNSDTINAERIMNDVIKSVPEGKIVSASYLTMASIQESKHDTVQQKKYIQLAIDKLNVEGNSQQAANEQKVLDDLK